MDIWKQLKSTYFIIPNNFSFNNFSKKSISGDARVQVLQEPVSLPSWSGLEFLGDPDIFGPLGLRGIRWYPTLSSILKREAFPRGELFQHIGFFILLLFLGTSALCTEIPRSDWFFFKTAHIGYHRSWHILPLYSSTLGPTNSTFKKNQAHCEFFQITSQLGCVNSKRNSTFLSKNLIWNKLSCQKWINWHKCYIFYSNFLLFIQKASSQTSFWAHFKVNILACQNHHNLNIW